MDSTLFNYVYIQKERGTFYVSRSDKVFGVT